MESRYSPLHQGHSRLLIQCTRSAQQGHYFSIFWKNSALIEIIQLAESYLEQTILLARATATSCKGILKEAVGTQTSMHIRNFWTPGLITQSTESVKRISK